MVPMVRLSAIFVALCMALIAIAIGAVAFLAFGLSGPEATIVAIGAMTALGLYDAVAKQLRSRTMFGEQIANLSRGTADLAWQVGDLTRQVAECTRRMVAIERKAELPLEHTRTAIPAFAAEISELGTIVKHLAEAVAAHETALANQRAIMSEPAPTPIEARPTIMSEVAILHERTEFNELETSTEAGADGAAPAMKHNAMATMVRDSLDENRADIYLQPIVTLPQRKIRYYEAFTRLRSDDGELLLPVDFIEAAEGAGLMPRVDLLVLARAGQVARRLLQKNRDVGLICNISAYTLVEPAARMQMQQFFEANQELAPSLVLEFPQSVWRAMGAFEQESIAELAELGVRFSMDHVTDLRMEPQDLADRGIRLIKVPVKLLLEAANKPDLDIHPTDLSNLLARFGIGLIAERIENESMVLELFEFDVRLGQGYLFSAPRPVRAEALQGQAEDEVGAERKTVSKPQPAPPRRTLAEAVEEIRRTGILPQPAPGGSHA